MNEHTTWDNFDFEDDGRARSDDDWAEAAAIAARRAASLSEKAPPERAEKPAGRRPEVPLPPAASDGTRKPTPEERWRESFDREMSTPEGRSSGGPARPEHEAAHPRRTPQEDGRSNDDRAYRRLPVPRPDADRGTELAELEGGYPVEYGTSFQDSGIDLRKYLWLLFRYRWLLLVAAAMGAVFGAVTTFLTTPVYRATATVQINRQVPQVMAGVAGDEGLSQVEGGRDSEFYQTQYELFRSRSLAERVVASLNLQDDATFLSSKVSSPISNLKKLVFGQAQEEVSASAEVKARQAAAVGQVMGNIAIRPVNNSTIVLVSFDNPNAAEAQKVANGIVDAYIEDNLARRYGATTYARNFLEERLAELKQKLADSEKQLVQYADKEKIVAPTEGQTLAQPNLAAANDALVKATNDRLHAQLLWDEVKDGGSVSVPQMLDSKTIAELRAKRADLETTYEDKLKTFKPAYPEMVKLKAQIDEIDKQIDGEVQLIKDSIKQQYDAAVAQEKALQQQVDALKGDVTDFRNRNIQYTILQREVDTNRTLYEGLLQRYKEVGVADGVGTSNISIVDRASGAAIVSPNLKKNLTTSVMIALLLAAGIAFGRERLDDTFKSPEDLEDTLGVPLLGIIPFSRSAEHHHRSLEDPRSAASEAYRSLRTALQFSTASGVPKTLLVTSSTAGEGKSTTAVMLAKHYAQVGMKVLLIDADLRKPSLPDHVQCDPSVGLTNCLAGAAVPPHVFQRTNQRGLTVIASGPIPPNPAELLAGSKMLALLTAVSDNFDLVILDAPPVAGLADAPLLSSFVDGVLFIIDGGQTRRNVAKAAMKRLVFARAHIVGAVINKLDVASAPYAYAYSQNDPYYYGYGAADANEEPRRKTHV